MTGETVLIAAYSGRALAQTARRAGYRPLVADAFGDLDTREAASHVRVVETAADAGFRTKPLIAALDDLAARASSKPIGLVLGSGFEDKPRLVTALASRYRLLGSDAATIADAKDPAKFFARLAGLNVAHPQTQNERPDIHAGWISKRIGGSGGRHIRDCTGGEQPRPRRYFQKVIDGDRISVGAIFDRRQSQDFFALTRQWIFPSAKLPCRYGGCVSKPALGQKLAQKLISDAQIVGRSLGLNGMASFDFIVADGVPHLLEVNPRPGASIDVLDEGGDFFLAHLGVWAGSDGAFTIGGRNGPPRAAAILHADRGALTLGETPWPEWSADRGSPGTFVPRGAPLATALAEGDTADAAEALARARLAELEDLIYGHATFVRDRSPD